MQKTTFAALECAHEAETEANKWVRDWDIFNCLALAAENAVDSEVLVDGKFVLVGDSKSPLFDKAALESLETVMALNCLKLSTQNQAKVAEWLRARGFTF